MNVFFVLAGVFFILDQAIKILLELVLNYQEAIVIIPNFFDITLVHNYGAAWSLFDGNRLFLILVTVVFLGVLYYVYLKDKDITKLEAIVLGLLVGGVLGNLCDRVIRGYVVDYLSFQFFHYHYPVFNLADSCIVIAVIMIFIDTVRRSIDERNNRK